MNASDSTPTAPERLSGKTIVYFSRHGGTTEPLSRYMQLEYPNTNFIVLPISYGKGDTTEAMKRDLVAVLKERPVDAVVFDTVYCPIDKVMDYATSPTTPILPANRKLPVVLFTGMPLSTEKTRYSPTHSKTYSVPRTVTSILQKSLHPDEFITEVERAIELGKGLRIGG